MAYKRTIRTVTKHTPFGPKRVRVAMGAYSDLSQGNCGSDQKYDPSISYAGVQGQCVNASQYDAAHAGQYPGATVSSGSFWSSLVGGLASAFNQPAPSSQPVVMPSSGISTTEMLAIGGGALLLVVLLTRR